MNRVLISTAFAAACALSLAALSSAIGQEAFFKGKTITIVVGSSPGGGYDTYARMLSRHMPRHIEGNPTIVISNMPGAGSNIAANYIYNVARKDGTFIGALYAGAPLEPLIGNTPVQHDPRKSHFLGSANNDIYVCVGRIESPVKTLQDVQQREFVVAAQHSSTTSDFPLILNEVFKTKFKLVMGYPGSRESGLAMEKGEVDGACGFAWPSISVTNPGWFGPNPKVRLIAQTHPTGHADLNKQGVPNVYNMTTAPEDKQTLDVFFSQMIFGRPFVLPPEVPADRVALLRKAFSAALADPGLLEEASRAKLEVNPVSGEEVEAIIKKVYATPPHIVSRIKTALNAQNKK